MMEPIIPRQTKRLSPPRRPFPRMNNREADTLERDVRKSGTLLRSPHAWREFLLEIYGFFSSQFDSESLLFVVRDNTGGILAAMETGKEMSSERQQLCEENLYARAMIGQYVERSLDKYLPRQEPSDATS